MAAENLVAPERGRLTRPAGFLEKEDFLFLKGLRRTLIEILPPSSYTDNTWQLVFGDQVGTLPLTGGRSLIIQPKLPIPDVMRMLAYALELPPRVLPDPAHCAGHDLVELWIQALVLGAHRRLARGLYQEYLPVTERRWSARGRPEVKMSVGTPHRYDLVWSHTVPSRDLPENQLLLAALRATCHIPLGDRALRNEAHRIHRRFRDQVRPSLNPLGEAERIHYHRLNEDYRPLHRLARYLLRQQGARLQDGDQERTAFLLDMPELFETYVTKALEQHFPSPHIVCRQPSIPIEPLGAPLRPDIVIEDAARAPRLILDVKYKTPDHRPDDLQQVLAYAKLLNCGHVGLIHPAPRGATEVSTARVGSARVWFTRIQMGLEESPEVAVGSILRGLSLFPGV